MKLSYTLWLTTILSIAPAFPSFCMDNNDEKGAPRNLSSFQGKLAGAKPIQDEQEQQFMAAFTGLMEKMLLGDGSDPVKMSVSNNIKAQPDFQKALTRNPGLKAYAESLERFSYELKRSQIQTRQELAKRIKDELEGKILPEQGYATDYISPTSPVRKVMLQGMYPMLTLLGQTDTWMTQTSKNIKFDFTHIEHIERRFKQDTEGFEHKLSNFKENIDIEKNKFTSLSQEKDNLLTVLSREIEDAATMFHSEYRLHDIEAGAEQCRLYLPIIYAIFADKNTSRLLKRHNKTLFDSIKNSLNIYKKSEKTLETWAQQLRSDLKRLASTHNQENKTEQEKQEKTDNTSNSLLPSLSKKTADLRSSSLSPTPEPIKKQEEDEEKKKPVSINASSSSSYSTATSSNSSKQSGSAEQTKDPLTEWLMNSNGPSGIKNSKSEYHFPSAQEEKEKRKKEAKEKKREKRETEQKDENLPEPKNVSSTAPKPEEKKTTPLIVLKGGYDTFEAIMNETYKGEMNAVELLIKNRFKGTAYLNKGRWHFAIPHISAFSAVFTSTLEPLEEQEPDIHQKGSSNNSASSGAAAATTTTMPPSSIKKGIHNPHKNGSKRLRFYHVNDIKNMFLRGGYTLETVINESTEPPLKSPVDE